MKPETGIAVIVDGVVVAWFNKFDDTVRDWCTDNYFGRWITCKAECPILIPLTEDEMKKAEADSEEMRKIFDERRKFPPCLECGAETPEQSETMCICSGDKDHCHGCELWPDD